MKVASTTEGSQMRFAKNGWFVVGCLLIGGLIQSTTPGQAPVGGQIGAGFQQPEFQQPLEGGLPPGLPEPRQTARPAQVTASAAAEGMMAFATNSPSGGQTVTVIDAQQRWMAVYSVDVGVGRIKLLSSRPLKQDLSIEFNAETPTPADIQKLQTP